MKHFLLAIFAVLLISSCSTDESTKNEFSTVAKEKPPAVLNQEKMTATKTRISAFGTFTPADEIRITQTETQPYFPNDNKLHVYHVIDASGGVYGGIVFDDATGCYHVAGWHGSATIITSSYVDAECHGWAWAVWAWLMN